MDENMCIRKPQAKGLTACVQHREHFTLFCPGFCVLSKLSASSPKVSTLRASGTHHSSLIYTTNLCAYIFEPVDFHAELLTIIEGLGKVISPLH